MPQFRRDLLVEGFQPGKKFDTSLSFGNSRVTVQLTICYQSATVKLYIWPRKNVSHSSFRQHMIQGDFFGETICIKERHPPAR